MAAKSRSNEIAITRIYDAPLRAVWDAWTDPKQVAMWWGPRGFSITTHARDLRSGGHWNYTMHGPDGVDYPNKTHYLEVEKYARLVYDHGGSDDRPPLFRVTVAFSEAGGKTKMDMRMTVATPEAADEVRKTIKKHHGNSTWDRLAEHLEQRATGQEKFVINRVFDAPIDVMFEMWTNPEHFARWLPPTEADMRFFRADIRAGGSAFFVISGAQGTKWGRNEYEVVEKPHRIVYRQQFCDENEKVVRHPFSPNFPETLRTTVLFADEGDATRVTVTWEPLGELTPAELETFVKERAGMTNGWTGSFDKLEALLG
jgi:uncharacterized protein YndB with AHSA1/START domain